MFTPEDRSRLRSELLDYASRDRRIRGCAITGSAAAEREDRWSDVDLAFGVDSAELINVLSDWTAYMYDRYSALHHCDVKAGVWIYRVFLLSNTLQVDLAFAPAEEFRPLAPTFRLMFGKANESRPSQSPQPNECIGVGWLYALHARSCIARRRFWQAEYMISGVRDNVLALACIRHRVPAAQGRGMDLLPPDVAAQFEDALVRQLNSEELSRAFRAATRSFLGEIRMVDAALEQRLHGVLTELTDNL
jgi:hypothetical protein